MKNLTITQLFFSAFFMSLLFSASDMTAQTRDQLDVAVIKDCHMMKDGKMMEVKAGKLSKMRKKVVLENGTKIKRNGMVVMADRKRVRMTEGNCIDNRGKIDNCTSISYTCPMHSDVINGKSGKCPKCGMALVEKK